MDSETKLSVVIAASVTSASLQWTLVTFDRIVDQLMSFKLVLAVERTVAEVTQKRFVIAVDHHVHLEVLLCLETLHAHWARVVH